MKSTIFLFLVTLLFSSFIKENKNLTAYIFIAEECPVCNNLGKSLKKLSFEYKDNINFVAVFPQKLSNFKTALNFKEKYNWDYFSIEIDHNRSITNRYNASVTPEVVLVDENDNILYQGRINNAYAAPGRMRHGAISEDLRIAINKILNDQKVPKPWPKPIGCYITKR